MNIDDKKSKLFAEITSYGSVAVAFSGGVDSTFLLSCAKEALGTDPSKLIAVTARSCSFPERELLEASAYCKEIGVSHYIVDSEELDIDGFSCNPTNRCYLCKSELFTKIGDIARAQGIAEIAEGSNTDDDGDYRPGLIAVAEQGVKSPLRAAGLSKEEIRTLSREMGLPTSEKQSFACLSSRFPYGELISREKLGMVDKAEQYLLDLGLRQVRVRIHESSDGTYLARIETEPSEFVKFFTKNEVGEEPRGLITEAFKSYGFSFVSLDLLGYRTGSMNEVLPQ